MIVTIYRRHAADCRYRKDRYSKRCDCALWMQYQDRPGHQVKRTCKTSDWEVATKMARDIEQAGLVAAAASDMTIREAIERYVAHKRDRGFAEWTIYTRERALISFRDFAEARGVVLLRQVTPSFLEDFRRTWNYKRTQDGKPAGYSWNTTTDTMRAFFRWAMKQEFILKDPSFTGLERVKTEVQPTMPFDAKEIEQLLYQVEKMPWTDPLKKLQVRAAILVGRHAGLACRDIVMLKRSSLSEDNTILITRAKTGTGVGVWIPVPQFVADTLRALPDNGRRAQPGYFFWSGCKPISAAQQLTLAISQVLDAAKVDRKRCYNVVHRLRDTFAVELILAGVPLQDVSMALGHSSIRMTEKHYRPWVEKMKARLVTTLRASWSAQGYAGD